MRWGAGGSGLVTLTSDDSRTTRYAYVDSPAGLQERRIETQPSVGHHHRRPTECRRPRLQERRMRWGLVAWGWF